MTGSLIHLFNSKVLNSIPLLLSLLCTYSLDLTSPYSRESRLLPGTANFNYLLILFEVVTESKKNHIRKNYRTILEFEALSMASDTESKANDGMP
jgi:hypothetical protein